ncbi:MAG: hypothetical protein ABR924_18835 [Terracidiphilus sp.]|jgi:hypothetical protein
MIHSIDSKAKSVVQPTASIKVTNAALAEASNGDIILRGLIDPSSLSGLQVDASYQRGVQGQKYIRGIMSGIPDRGGVPDIELGMRGHSYTEAGDDFFLHDPVYIIDGLQRTTAALGVLQAGIQPRIGAMIHFDTVSRWERERFEVLNMKRSPVASNILIRNLGEENKAIKLMLSLSKSSVFVLSDRVCWQQKMKRSELIHAQTMLKVIATLHSRWAGLSSTSCTKLADIVEKRVYDEIGQVMLWQNIKTFFELIDKCWGIRTIQYANKASFMKGGFLRVLARVLADHQDFWNKNALVISTDLTRKIGLFAIHDNHVAYLCGAAGKAQSQLYQLLVEHINSGKRTRRLVPFDQVVSGNDHDNDNEDQTDAA